MGIKLERHHGIDIVVGQVAGDKWLVTWAFPDEDEVIHIYRPTESQALSYAKKQIDQFFGVTQMPTTMPVVWRKGGDWWSGIEVENGVVPSDAVPYYPEYEE